ncbi:MAG: C40 family peptidase [Magnetococcales bacterium]|nr:C40 family peptidase [Magnetococcales bacterium]
MIRLLPLLMILLLGQLLSGCASAPPPPPPAPQTLNYQEIIRTLEKRTPEVAKNYFGFPYKLAANPDRVRAADCTHLVCAITRNSLENTPYRFAPYYMASGAMVDSTYPISRDELRAGDIIIFADEKKKQVEHAGIVVAKNREQIRFVHASSMKGVMETSTLDIGYRSYWQRRFDSYRRWKPQVFALRASNLLAANYP